MSFAWDSWEVEVAHSETAGQIHGSLPDQSWTCTHPAPTVYRWLMSLMEASSKPTEYLICPVQKGHGYVKNWHKIWQRVMALVHYFFKLCSLMEILPLIGAFAFQTRLGLEITSPQWTTNPQPKAWKALSSVPCLNPSSHAVRQPHMNCTALRTWWEAHFFFPQEFSVSARRKVLTSWLWERQVEV